MIALFLILSSFAHADWFVVPDESNASKNVIVQAVGFAPKGAITTAPLDESGRPYPIEALDIVVEPVPDSHDQLRTVAKLNQDKLDAFLKAEKKAKDDSAAAKAKDDLDKSTRFSNVSKECAKQTSAIMLAVCDMLLKDVVTGKVAAKAQALKIKRK